MLILVINSFANNEKDVIKSAKIMTKKHDHLTAIKLISLMILKLNSHQITILHLNTRHTFTAIF